MTVSQGARGLAVAYARLARTVALLRGSRALIAVAEVLHNAGVTLAEKVPGAVPPLRIYRDGDTTVRTFPGLGIAVSPEMAEHRWPELLFTEEGPTLR